VSALDELGTAAECVEGARQALARASEVIDDLPWLQKLADPDRDLEQVQFALRHLIMQRRQVER